MVGIMAGVLLVGIIIGLATSTIVTTKLLMEVTDTLKEMQREITRN